MDSLLCVQLSQNGDTRTQYSIEGREDGFSAPNIANRLFYPLQASTTYGVEVSCCQYSKIRKRMQVKGKGGRSKEVLGEGVEIYYYRGNL